MLSVSCSTRILWAEALHIRPHPRKAQCSPQCKWTKFLCLQLVSPSINWIIQSSRTSSQDTKRLTFLLIRALCPFIVPVTRFQQVGAVTEWGISVTAEVAVLCV